MPRRDAGVGIFGSIRTEAFGEGILLRGGGVLDLPATASGQVEEVLVTVGEVVEQDQPVAEWPKIPLDFRLSVGLDFLSFGVEGTGPIEAVRESPTRESLPTGSVETLLWLEGRV